MAQLIVDNLAPAQHPSATSPTAEDAYRLLRPLEPGSYGAAFLGVELASGEPVEMRRLSEALQTDRRDDLTTRLRLVGLLWQSATRRVRHSDLESTPPTIILDHAGDETLDVWATRETTTPDDLRKLLLAVVECLVEAHHFGLTHGGLRPTTIGIVEGTPKLDFTGYAIRDGASSPVGSPEAKADDSRAFAGLVAWALEIDRFEEACRVSSHREAARLKQLASAGEASTIEQAELAVFITCLQQLDPNQGQPPPSEAGNQINEMTSELAGASPDAPSDESTRDVVLPGFDSDRTSEVGLAGPLPTGLANAKKGPQVGDRLGRFQIEQKLGQGGMGAVFKAIDLGSQQVVALKVLNQDALLRGNAVQRFAKEARLLASLNNPYITNLIEVSDQDGLHYIALEFVDGVDLSKVLKAHGRLGERTALALAADVARALVDAHQREIVHRDIKPENVLLVDWDASRPLDEIPPRAKLADFGIARHIDQSQSLAVTQAGSMLGTPKYMSPEQCRGRGEVMPQSDVYSLGVTLFELLSGHPPFVADDPMTMAGKHCFDAPPSLRKLVSELSEPVAELVEKCLAKRPEDRFADAGHLLQAIERLLRGEPSSATRRPRLPAHNEAQVTSNEMTWQMKASPEVLWPYVSNTERLNRAIGLPPVEYRTENDPLRGVRRFGTIHLAGFTMSWEEYPFEWVEGRRMSIFREFGTGPFRWFVSTVELKPLPEGGTELVHTVKILPRNTIGKVIAWVETGSKCERSLNRVYERIDTTLQQGRGVLESDPFESAPKLKASQRDRLLSGSDALRSGGADAQATEKLTGFLLTAPDQEVESIRPVALARQLDLDEDKLLDACLSGVAEGLLTLHWDILCPTCRVAADTRETLKQVEAHTHCEACDYDFDSGTAGAVELIFRAHKDVRNTAIGKYCIGGPWHAPHVVAQLRLDPHERIETELSLPPGEYVLRGPQLVQSFRLRVVTGGASSQQSFLLSSAAESGRTFTLRSGSQVVSIENGFENLQVIRIERTIPRDDVFTAARASATPRFRELFPGEVFDSGRLVSAEQITMLTAAIPSIDDLYTTQGDAEAFKLVEEHLAGSGAIIRAHGGEVVKVIGETVFASFHSPRRAVEAAFELGMPSCECDFQLAVGVHRGPALVTTSNNRLDYFGATARQATALPTLVGEGIALTEPVLADADTSGWLAQHDHAGEVRTIDLPGKPGQLIQFFAVN